MGRKMIKYLSIFICLFMCTTKVYAGNMDGFEKLPLYFNHFIITVCVLPIFFVVYIILLCCYFSKKKKKQTKEVQKTVKKIKFWLYILAIPVIIYLIYSFYIYIALPLI